MKKGSDYRFFFPSVNPKKAKMYLISSPETLKKAFSTQYETYDRTTMEQERFDDFLGGGLIIESNGDIWKKHRELGLRKMRNSQNFEQHSNNNSKSRLLEGKFAEISSNNC